jgi:hypothetical protein
LGRYGSDALSLINAAQTGEMETIPGTDYLWSELRWAARSEGVVHLDDLLLRRTRLGLILPYGGEAILPVVKQICSDELHWSNNRWQMELTAYCALWKKSYSLPDFVTIPDWKVLLLKAKINKKSGVQKHRQQVIRRFCLILGGILFGTAILALIWKNMKHSRIYSISNKADGQGI